MRLPPPGPWRVASLAAVAAVAVLLAVLAVGALGGDGGDDAAGDGRDAAEGGASDGAAEDDGGEAGADAGTAATGGEQVDALTAGLDCQDTVAVPAAEGSEAEQRCLLDDGWVEVVGFEDEDQRGAFEEDGGVLDCSFLGLSGGGGITVQYVVGDTWIARVPQGADAAALAEALGGEVREAECGDGGRSNEALEALGCEQQIPAQAPAGATSASQCLLGDGWATVYAFESGDARSAFRRAGAGFDCSFISGFGGGVVGQTVSTGTTLVFAASSDVAAAVADVLGGTVDDVTCAAAG